MSEENVRDTVNNGDGHPGTCLYEKEHEDDDGDSDEDVSGIRTPLIIDDAIKTPRSGFKELVFQFPSATPRSILKSTNNNLVRRGAKTKMRTFLTVPGTSVSMCSGQESSSKCPASTPLPLSVIGKSNVLHSIRCNI